MSLLLYSDIAYEGFEKLKNVVKSQVQPILSTTGQYKHYGSCGYHTK